MLPTTSSQTATTEPKEFDWFGQAAFQALHLASPTTILTKSSLTSFFRPGFHLLYIRWSTIILEDIAIIYQAYEDQKIHNRVYKYRFPPAKVI